MRVLVTGQSGLNKGKYLNDIKSFCNNKTILNNLYRDFIDLDIYQKAQIDEVIDLDNELVKQGYEQPGYMDMDEDKLLLAKNKVMDNIIERCEGKENVILGLHAVYYRRNSFRHAIDWSKLREFKPDLIVTLIDDIHTTRERIINRGYADPSSFYTLRDIIVWREVELLMSLTMARNINSIQHKILALNQGPLPLYQLMFESRHPKALGENGKYEVYASFPVTEAERDRDLKKQTEDFRNTLKRYFIVYDPMAIGEKILHNEFSNNFQKSFPDKEIVIKYDNRSFRFSSSEIMEVIHDINGQIISRDERLVEQSDAVIAFRPTLSSGSRYELSHAKKTGKVKAFAIIPQADIGKSPFDISSFVDKYWNTLEEMIPNLGKIGLIREKEINRWR